MTIAGAPASGDVISLFDVATKVFSELFTKVFPLSFFFKFLALSFFTRRKVIFMDLKFMEPQSRWVMKTLFRRDFDAFVDSAKRRVNWSMLLWDIIIVWIVLQLL